MATEPGSFQWPIFSGCCGRYLFYSITLAVCTLFFLPLYKA